MTQFGNSSTMYSLTSPSLATGQRTPEIEIKPFPIPKVNVGTMMSLQNRGRDNQTNVESFVGASNRVEYNLEQYMPFAPLSPEPHVSFRTDQRWEGVVLSMSSDTFTARLTTIRGEGPDQVAEIYLNEVDEPDRVLLKPGSVFYWSIGYIDRPSGRINASVMRLRRLPAWSRQEIERAKAEATQLAQLFADE